MCPRRGGFSGILSEGGNSTALCRRGKFSGPLPLCQRGEGMELSGSLPRGDSRGLCQRGDSWGLFQRVAKGWEILGIFAKGRHSLIFLRRGETLWFLEKGWNSRVFGKGVRFLGFLAKGGAILCLIFEEEVFWIFFAIWGNSR